MSIQAFFEVKSLKDKLYVFKPIDIDGQKWIVWKKNPDSVDLVQADENRKVNKQLTLSYVDLISKMSKMVVTE